TTPRSATSITAARFSTTTSSGRVANLSNAADSDVVGRAWAITASAIPGLLRCFQEGLCARYLLHEACVQRQHTRLECRAVAIRNRHAELLEVFDRLRLELRGAPEMVVRRLLNRQQQ